MTLTPLNHARKFDNREALPSEPFAAGTILEIDFGRLLSTGAIPFTEAPTDDSLRLRVTVVVEKLLDTTAELI